MRGDDAPQRLLGERPVAAGWRPGRFGLTVVGQGGAVHWYGVLGWAHPGIQRGFFKDAQGIREG